MGASATTASLPSLTGHTEHMDRLRRDVAGFERLATHLKRLAGINLAANDKNLSLLAARLGSILTACDLPSYTHLAQLLSEGDAEVERLFIEALTTNTTHFFRESAHFERLAQVLPDLLRSRQAEGKHDLRLWCAACSTGQEAYTMLMTVLEAAPTLLPQNLKFLASDIDKAVLSRAAQGGYGKNEVDGVPPLLRSKYFASANDGQTWRVGAMYRRLITFAPLNLRLKTLPFQYGFDVIFCRNVLIYFERELALEVTGRLMRALSPGGYLFLGHSESGLIKGPGFKSIASAVYRKDG